MDKSDILTYMLVITGFITFAEALVFAFWKLWEVYLTYGLTWFGAALIAPVLCVISLIGALKV